MIDRDRIERFWEQRAAIDEPRLSSHFRHDDSHVFDAALVLREMRTGGSLLDLGSGPGTLTGTLLPQVRRLVAVDFRGEFFRFLPDDPKIEAIVADVVTFETTETFDNILMFGLVNYLSPQPGRDHLRESRTDVTPGRCVHRQAPDRK